MDIGILFAGGILTIALIFIISVISVMISKPLSPDSVKFTAEGTGNGIHVVQKLLSGKNEE